MIYILPNESIEEINFDIEIEKINRGFTKGQGAIFFDLL